MATKRVNAGHAMAANIARARSKRKIQSSIDDAKLTIEKAKGRLGSLRAELKAMSK
jgi:outer membrane protein TolC